MSTCSHHCYTEEKNVTLNEYLYVDLDKLFLKEQHAFPLKVRPTNLQTHIDKPSIDRYSIKVTFTKKKSI